MQCSGVVLEGGGEVCDGEGVIWHGCRSPQVDHVHLHQLRQSTRTREGTANNNDKDQHTSFIVLLDNYPIKTVHSQHMESGLY